MPVDQVLVAVPELAGGQPEQGVPSESQRISEEIYSTAAPLHSQRCIFTILRRKMFPKMRNQKKT
ncbi:hypothetical protein PM8797T_31228 [Gimesia maris DSM 8797]|nr:hypothetical protein PM8797T_31228 [Gimesia maris DSM 8797]